MKKLDGTAVCLMPLENFCLANQIQINTKIRVVTRLKKTIRLTNVGIRSSQQINMRKSLKFGELCKNISPSTSPVTPGYGQRHESTNLGSKLPRPSGSNSHWRLINVRDPQPPPLPPAMANGTRARTLGVNSQDPRVVTATGG